MERYQDTADLFFSVHHNAANTAARGAEALAQVADKSGVPTKILAEKLLEEYRVLGVPIRSIVFREGQPRRLLLHQPRGGFALHPGAHERILLY